MLSFAARYYKTYNSTVSMRFRNAEFHTVTRNKLFGVTDTIADIGGILGLCLGVSAISFIEIVYFVFLSLFIRKVITKK